MKLVFLFAVAFIAFAEPIEGLSCYHCKSANYLSSMNDFNKDFEICGDDQSKWPTKNGTVQGFDKCKKIVEKIKVNEKDDVLVIRTIGPYAMGLNQDKFTEYTCDTNLCNSAVTACATAFAVLLSIAALLVPHI